MRIKFTKQQLEEAKKAQSIVAKKAKDPNFNESIPNAEAEVNRLNI